MNKPTITIEFGIYGNGAVVKSTDHAALVDALKGHDVIVHSDFVCVNMVANGLWTDAAIVVMRML